MPAEEPASSPSAPPAGEMPPGQQGYVQYQPPSIPGINRLGRPAVSPISAVIYHPPESVTYVPGRQQAEDDAPEPDLGFTGSFSDKAVRQKFVSKVYSILTVQIIINFGICLIVSVIPEAVDFVHDNGLILIFTGGTTMFGVLIFAYCNPNSMRAYPSNYVLLVTFTLGNAVAMVCLFTVFTIESMLYAIGATLLIFLVLTMFAKQACCDFTKYQDILMVVLLLFIIFGFFQMFFPGKTMTLVYHSLGVFIFSVYIILDTQLLMGGHKFEISPEDYMLASLVLFLDIVNLFVHLLHFIGDWREKMISYD